MPTTVGELREALEHFPDDAIFGAACHQPYFEVTEAGTGQRLVRLWHKEGEPLKKDFT